MTHFKNGTALQDTVWYVQTKDGTTYQFGSTTPGDFGNRSWWAYDRANQDSGADCGTYIETYRWYLTQVTDTHGNELVYTYNKVGSTISNAGCGSSISGYTVGDVWPETIQWGSSGNRRFQVTFESTQRADDLEYDKPAAMLGQGPHDTRQLNDILVQSKQATSWELIRRYDFTYDYTLRPDNGNAYPKLTLKQVEMTGADGTSTLPATTYTYHTDGANYTAGKYRLETANNGYGGTVTYAYATFLLNGNYRNRVTTRTVGDGLGHSYTWSYAYTNAADNNQSYSAAIWWALHVAGDTSYLVHSQYSEFRGHRQVTVTDPNLNKVEHWFVQGDGYDETNGACTIAGWGDACALRRQDQEALLGKEWKTVSHSSSTSVTYNKSLSDFTVEHYTDSQDDKTGVRWTFSYLSQSVAYTYDGDLSERHQTTQYEYNTGYQGSAQWGNLTHVKEYGERTPGLGVDPLRTKTQRYAINTDAWIVGAVVETGVYSGTSAIAANWQSLSYSIYDTQHPFDAPTVGNLTRVMQVKTLNTSNWLATTADVAYVYDSYGNRTKEQVYNGDGSLTIGPGGSYTPATADLRETVYTYDGNFHLYLEQVMYDYPGSIHKNEQALYDYKLGLVTLYTDVNSDQTQYQYDTFGRFSKMLKPGDTDWAKPTVENDYFDNNLEPQAPMMWQVWYKGDSNAGPWTTGGTWQRQFYDGLGRLVQVQTPDWDWDGAGGGHELVTYTTYDGLKQKTAESVPYQRTPYAYNGNCNGTGRICTPYLAPDTSQPKTQYQYDPIGRVTQVTNPDNSTVQTVYSDWTTTTYDELDHQGYQETDALGRLVQVREYTGIAAPYTWYTTTSYDYDVSDQLTTITDEASNQITFVYDRLGRQTELTDPDLGHWYYAYDNVGNMTRQTDAGGQRVCMYYDILNRITGKHYRTDDNCPGSPTLDVTYQYDNILSDADASNSWGKLRRAYVGSLSPANNVHEYQYDTRGRTLWERVTLDGTNYDTSYAYDSLDRVRTMTYPDTEVVTNSYPRNNALNSVTSNNGATYVGNVDYTETGAVDKMYLGAANPGLIQVDYAYYGWTGTGGNARSRLNWIKAGLSGGSGLLSLTYSYDLVGNITSIVDANAGPQTQNFYYDDLARLTSASATGESQGTYNESYAYTGTDGKLGNLTSKTGTGYYYYGAQQSSCPDGALTKPHAVWRTVNGGTANYYCYDADGNQVKRTIGGTVYNLSYDQENRLSGESGGATATFTYGPGGERVKGVVGTSPAVTTYYIGTHYEVEGSTPHKYYYAVSTRVAMRDNGTLYYLFADHLGSTAITANSSGSKVAEVRYRAFGENRYTSGTTPTTYRYTGQRQEVGMGPGSGLYYYNARWYDPTLGRFVQADTVVPDAGDPQQLSRFSYVGNNPLLYTDPTGHMRLNEMAAGGSFDGYQTRALRLDEVMAMPRQEAVEYVAWLVERKTGVGPAGRTVEYIPEYWTQDPDTQAFRPDPTILGVTPLTGPAASNIYITEAAFSSANTVGDIAGTEYHEFSHASQNVTIEANHPGTFETEAGGRYIPGMEVDACNKTLAQSETLGYSQSYYDSMYYYGSWNDAYLHTLSPQYGYYYDENEIYN